MSWLKGLCGVAALLVIVMSAAGVQAGNRASKLAVVMTNDPVTNEIKVYDVGGNALVQTLPSHGMGGVGGNARASTPITRFASSAVQPTGTQASPRLVFASAPMVHLSSAAFPSPGTRG